MSANREPPMAHEAEVSVLGALLIGGPDATGEVVGTLEPEHFYREAHRRICRAIYGLYGKGEDPDPTAIAEQLRLTGDLEAVGGMKYLAELMDAVPTAASVAYHARIVTDRARRRGLIEAGTEIVREAYDSSDEAGTLVDRAERRIMEVGESARRENLSPIKSALGPAMGEIERRQNSPGGVTGIATGFADLDHRTGGLQAGNLIVLAARPSMGKSALATSILLNAAVKEKKTAALFSLEMSKEEVVHRMLAYEGMLDLGRMLRGKMIDSDFPHLHHAAALLNKAPIWVDESADLSVLEIRAKARRLAMQQELGLIVVDYLQLMRGGGEENRNQEVSAISRGLKLLAKELHVPVIALSQLSRKCEERSTKRPILSDLRESGAIEQDADIVMFLFRPEVYVTDGEARDEQIEGVAELIIAKQRNGPTGTIDLFFRKECARFEDTTRKEKERAA